MMPILSDLPEAIREAAADLDDNGQRALETAASAVDVERYPFAIIRYARAVELAERTRAEWQDHGAPLLSTHINGATVVHPLVRLLRDLESDAAAAARSVFLDPATAEKRKPGGQVGSARAKDRQMPARPHRPEPPIVTRREWSNEPPVVRLSRRVLDERGAA